MMRQGRYEGTTDLLSRGPWRHSATALTVAWCWTLLTELHFRWESLARLLGDFNTLADVILMFLVTAAVMVVAGRAIARPAGRLIIAAGAALLATPMQPAVRAVLGIGVVMPGFVDMLPLAVQLICAAALGALLASLIHSLSRAVDASEDLGTARQRT